MKPILREYLASLREREELDAILPDLLSELGFNVYSRPKRGTTQHGVDVAAVGPANSGEEKLYLFSIKKGDLNRQDWDGTPQALRSSLNEIEDVYIRNHIPPQYAQLKIVICLCFGGEINENVRDKVVGYTSGHTTDRISFEEWNGDKLAGMLLDGILREELLPKHLRSNFQKALALLDEPDAAYRHFTRLVRSVLDAIPTDTKGKIRAARQIYICLWIMFAWARDIENVEAPYLASELTILSLWEVSKALPTEDKQGRKDLFQIIEQCIQVHLAIASELLEKKIAPHVRTRDALSMAVRSQSNVDVNLKLFDLLGRISMAGLWLQYFAYRQQGEVQLATKKGANKFCDIGMSMIENNPSLFLPLCDEQATSIALFLMLCVRSEIDPIRPISWLQEMVHRYEFSIHTAGRYPVCLKEYRRLIDHPANSSKEYFEEATAGSTLLPLLAAWLVGFGRADLVARLSKLAVNKLSHCNMQLWTPDKSSEEHFYVNTEQHGVAISDLPLTEDGIDLVKTISAACDREKSVEELSVMKVGLELIALMACRHWRLPIPPVFWISALADVVKDHASDSPTKNELIAPN